MPSNFAFRQWKKHVHGRGVGEIELNSCGGQSELPLSFQQGFRGKEIPQGAENFESVCGRATLRPPAEMKRSKSSARVCIHISRTYFTLDIILIETLEPPQSLNEAQTRGIQATPPGPPSLPKNSLAARIIIIALSIYLFGTPFARTRSTIATNSRTPRPKAPLSLPRP